MEAAEALEKQLEAAGVDVLIDDRDQRPGVKFKDADLIGIPLRVVDRRARAEGGDDRGQVADRRRGAPRRGGDGRRGDPGRAWRRPAEDASPAPERRTARAAAKGQPDAAPSPLPAEGPARPARAADLATFGGPARHPGDHPRRPEPGLAAGPAGRVVDVRRWSSPRSSS